MNDIQQYENNSFENLNKIIALTKKLKQKYKNSKESYSNNFFDELDVISAIHIKNVFVSEILDSIIFAIHKISTINASIVVSMVDDKEQQNSINSVKIKPKDIIDPIKSLFAKNSDEIKNKESEQSDETENTQDFDVINKFKEDADKIDKEADVLSAKMKWLTALSGIGIASLFLSKTNILSDMKNSVISFVDSGLELIKEFLFGIKQFFSNFNIVEKIKAMPSELINFFNKTFKMNTDKNNIEFGLISVLNPILGSSIFLFNNIRSYIFDIDDKKVKIDANRIEKINKEKDSFSDGSQPYDGGPVGKGVSGDANYHGYDQIMLRAWASEGFSGTDFLYLKAQVFAESRYDMFAKSSAAAHGLTQFIRGTAQAYGIGDVWANPQMTEEHAYRMFKAQAQYMKRLKSMFGSWDKALWGYNAGEGNVQKGIFPAQSRDYIAKINTYKSQMSLDPKAQIILRGGKQTKVIGSTNGKGGPDEDELLQPVIIKNARNFHEIKALSKNQNIAKTSTTKLITVKNDKNSHEIKSSSKNQNTTKTPTTKLITVKNDRNFYEIKSLPTDYDSIISATYGLPIIKNDNKKLNNNNAQTINKQPLIYSNQNNNSSDIQTLDISNSSSGESSYISNTLLDLLFDLDIQGNMASI